MGNLHEKEDMVQESILLLQKQLVPLYGEREASNIVKILLEDLFGVKHIEKQWKNINLEQLSNAKQRLLSLEPIQYITNTAYFYGYPFHVSSSVLIPRPETEELVYTILQKTKSMGRAALLDIGTGSGCIPISIKKKQKGIQCTGIDVSEDALDVARKNAVKLQAEINFKCLDILDRSVWSSLEHFDIIVSNPPYIPPSEAHLMPDNVKKFEPSIALFVSEENPLLFYKKIIDLSLIKLKPNGWLFFEVNEYYAAKVSRLFNELPFEKVEIISDLQGKERMVIAKRMA